MLVGANTWIATLNLFTALLFKEVGNKNYIFQTSLQLGFCILCTLYIRCTHVRWGRRFHFLTSPDGYSDLDDLLKPNSTLWDFYVFSPGYTFS